MTNDTQRRSTYNLPQRGWHPHLSLYCSDMLPHWVAATNTNIDLLLLLLLRMASEGQLKHLRCAASA
jgi:hypothetical protein